MSRTRFLAGYVMGFIAVGFANAEDRFWLNAQGGYWRDPANWSGGVVPNHEDCAVLAIETTGGITIDQSHSVGCLQSFTNRIVIAFEGALHVSGDALLSGTGPFEIVAPSMGDPRVKLTVGGTMTNWFQTIVFPPSDGTARVETAEFVNLQSGAPGSIEVNGVDVVWTIVGGEFVNQSTVNLNCHFSRCGHLHIDGAYVQTETGITNHTWVTPGFSRLSCDSASVEGRIGVRLADSYIPPVTLWHSGLVESSAVVDSISCDDLVPLTLGSGVRLSLVRDGRGLGARVTTAPRHIGDLQCDCSVGLSDLTVLLANFGMPGTPEEGDLDGDGWITLADLAVFLSHFGDAC